MLTFMRISGSQIWPAEPHPISARVGPGESLGEEGGRGPGFAREGSGEPIVCTRQLIYLEGAGIRVHGPVMRHPVSRVDALLLNAVLLDLQILGARCRDLALTKEKDAGWRMLHSLRSTSKGATKIWPSFLGFTSLIRIHANWIDPGATRP